MRNGLVFIDDFELYTKIAQLAYFKWLAGSHDAVRNWLEAEQEVLNDYLRVK